MCLKDKELEEMAKEKQREYMRQYRKNNREKINEYHRKYRKENPEKIKEINNRYWKNRVLEELKEG